MATVGGALSTAWNATKWSARNLTPIGKNGRLIYTLAGATALTLTLAAPPQLSQQQRKVSPHLLA